VATPRARLTPELGAELARHKAGLLEVLAWDEDAAYDLARKALAYLNESHQRAGAPDFSLEPLDEPERRIDAACEERDMFAYRIATREWVRAGLREIERAQALYLPAASPSPPTLVKGAS
jgi:acetyl-CoA carboxylase carboxyltransferase component